MAFLTKEKKFFTLKNEENQNVGPGLYISQTQQRMLKHSIAPFGTTSQKYISFFSNNFPGPGSYFITKNTIFPTRNYSQKQILTINSNPDHLNRSKSENFNKTSPTSFGLIERFKFQNKTKEFPGPGHYFKDDDDINKKLKKSKKIKNIFSISIKNLDIYNNNNKSNSNSKSKSKSISDRQFKCNLSSPFFNASAIPPKSNIFGFEISIGGDIFPKDNPDMQKTFSGEKSATVGPGAYELDTPENWHKTGTEWSKMKTFRMRPETNKSKKIKKSILKSLQENGDLKRVSLREIEQIKQNNLIYKYNIKQNAIFPLPKKKGFIEYENKKHENIPGPGYYFSENKIPKTENEKIINSLESNRNRFPNDKNSELNQTSPTTYFTDTEKRKNKLKQKFSFPIKTKLLQMITPNEYSGKQYPFNSTSTRFGKMKKVKKRKSKDKDVTEPNHFISHSFNSKYINFGALSQRFRAKSTSEEHVPGPGTYINPYSATGTSNTIEYNGIVMSLQEARKLNEGKGEKSNNILPNKENQAFGQYYPEFYNSIQFKNFKKANRTLMVPFGNGTPKVDIWSKKDNLGPGKYIRDRDVNVEQIYPPFGVRDKRNLNKEIKNKIPFGNYDLDRVFPWKKKGFNKLYI